MPRVMKLNLVGIVAKKMTNASGKMSNRIDQLEQAMDQYLATLQAPSKLKEAMRYSLDAGGKRIRPLLTLAFKEYFTGEVVTSDIDVAACIEMIHTYSLIHDDLPEMDNDDLRRGKPTNHKVFGQAMAVLAGDGLLTSAFERLTTISLAPAVIIELTHKLALAAGAQGMVGGQVGDILGEQKQLTLAELQMVHEGKTGALLQYACEAGAILAAQPPTVKEIVAHFGLNFGLAFQIYDDIQDVVSTTAKMGKKVHKDQAHNKNTYPGLLGLAGAQEHLTKMVAICRSDLLQLEQITGQEPSTLNEFLEYFKR